eukprot:gnl/TRDRNA2_/TRDRNA2_75708_c0_seq1.p1 gnl/TRDRNA2_/TRDRNA2_75708_c0~~gnl/TRDRNA2_/TRDRNA2_75708_c0_seq1.p1  ORF type:complete len:188 (+),score=10.01 gnl/TRDRNA2_/TRDRNA2_75708_c0_seq1:72-566(+)
MAAEGVRHSEVLNLENFDGIRLGKMTPRPSGATPRPEDVQRQMQHEESQLLSMTFEEIRSPEPFLFTSLTQGFMYMAKCVKSGQCAGLDAGEVRFWGALSEPRQVQMTFGEKGPLTGKLNIQQDQWTDLTLMKAVATLYEIATQGAELIIDATPPSLHFLKRAC